VYCLVILSRTLRLRGRHCRLCFGWRFVWCVGVACNVCCLYKRWFGVGHLVLGLASGLEAFSREPPCDGVGALAVRQTPETSGTASEFLSYYLILPSRYQRDPLSNLTRFFFRSLAAFQEMGATSQASHAVRGPKTAPVSLCAINLFLAIPS